MGRRVRDRRLVVGTMEREAQAGRRVRRLKKVDGACFEDGGAEMRDVQVEKREGGEG